MNVLLIKELFRCIRHSLSRFLAIVAIMALGVGFYAGLRMSAPDMRIAADAYFAQQQLFDLRIISNAGMEQDQIEVLSQIPGVARVMPCFEQDALAQTQDSYFSLRVQSFDFAALKNPELQGSLLNMPKLIQGRVPKDDHECVLGAAALESLGLRLGDKISLIPRSDEQDNMLDQQEFTIVGAVESPQYPSKNLLGFTRVGSGNLQAYCLVLPSAFKPGLPYAEAFVQMKDAAQQLSDPERYDSQLNELKERITAKLPDLETSRLEEMRSALRKRLDAQWAQFNERRQETSENFERMGVQLKNSEASQLSSEAEVHTERTSLDKSLQALRDKNAELDRGFFLQQQEIEQIKQELQATQQLVERSQAKLLGLQTAARKAQEKYDLLSQQAKELAFALQAKEEELKNTSQTDPYYQDILRTYRELEVQVRQAKREEAAAEANLKSAQDAVSQEKTTLDMLRAQVTEKSQAIAQRTQALSTQKEQLSGNLKKSEEGLALANERLQAAETLLGSGRSQIAQARQEFESAQAQALESLREGQSQLEEAERRLQELDKPVWHVLDRSKNAGILSYKEDANRLDQIAQIFPLFFFLVAALVALTTMTRMVEEERIYIGTRKALGFSSGSIALKYVSYALLAAGIGGVLGLYIFSQSIPVIIHQAYATSYSVEGVYLAPNLSITLSSLGAGLGSALVATLVCVWASLREVPAHLMLPRSPLFGKRIFLEYLPLWRFLSFSWKISLRNVFRDKRRLSMTLVGVAGCTALLLTGLGLNDAISGIIERQYKEIQHYDAELSLKPKAQVDDLRGFQQLLADKDLVDESCAVASQNFIAQGEGVPDLSVRVVCPESIDNFDHFWTLRDTSGSGDIQFNDRSLVLTEKLASQLNLKVGSQITLRHQDLVGNPVGEDLTGTVTGICENYVGNKIFVGKTAYQDLTKTHPNFSDYLVRLVNKQTSTESLSDRVRKLAVIETASYSNELIKSYEKNLESVHMVVALLVVAAALLAAIVLYNLNNINISERAREVATLKVLGFTPREVNAYIFREVMLLCLGGAVLGLMLGRVLEAFVVITAETEQLMFVREIMPLSFVGALLLTLVFGVLVNLMLRPKLKRIDMVESLKSIE